MAIREQFHDAPGRPERLVAVLDCRGANSLKVNVLRFSPGQREEERYHTLITIVVLGRGERRRIILSSYGSREGSLLLFSKEDTFSQSQYFIWCNLIKVTKILVRSAGLAGGDPDPRSCTDTQPALPGPVAEVLFGGDARHHQVAH